MPTLCIVIFMRGLCDYLKPGKETYGQISYNPRGI
jgi:hypothetical protein